jgi:hypothetical protein
MRNNPSLFSPEKISAAVLVLAAIFSGAAVQPSAHAQTAPNFGPNVVIFDPSMSGASISTTLTNASNETQFSTNRHAFLFKPGTYNGVSSEVGFYESIAGLGTTPDAVVLNGGGVYSDRTDSNGNVTTNFWRSVENMRVNPPLDSNGTTRTNRWGVSQAAPFRRMHIGGGDLELTNASCGFASGGFISDSVVDGKIESCSQQQWYTRNTTMGSWTGNVWNMVFSGDIGAPAQHFPNPSYTNVANTPVSREKPFLYIDSSGNYNVFVPTLRTNSSGTSWSGGGLGAGYSVALSNFFIAQPSNTAADINAALTSGKNLILTPGIYQLSAPINIANANTIVLGLGYPTLVPQNGTAAIAVADVDGVQLAALLIDAGPTNSPVLLQLGNTSSRVSHANNPTSLNDIFVRIGGATAGKATTSLEVDSDNVILDNIWAWRADHGNAGTTGWTVNTAAHGLVVTGDNVTALGLAVEHYQQGEVVWNGNGGETIFYQAELPYDVPSQSAWTSNGANGYPSYTVGSTVCAHQGYGMGVYSFFNQGVNIVEDTAIKMPNVTGVNVTDAVSVFLNGSGSITHVVNNLGATAQSGSGPIYLNAFTGSGTCAAGGGGGSTVQIDAGSTTAQGSYVADKDFSGGGTYSTTNAITVASGDTASQAVYQTARQGVFTYTIPVSAGTHTVKLHFAELFFSTAGSRVFNVSINNAAYLTNFDIVKTTGGKDIATVQTTTASAVNGQIVISFSKGTVDQPMVEGIEVQ